MDIPFFTPASFFFFQAEDGIRDFTVTGVQTCALPICRRRSAHRSGLDELAEPRRVWRIERRSPGRGGADAAPGSFRRGVLRRAPARHASVPELPDRAVLEIGRASCRERV